MPTAAKHVLDAAQEKRIPDSKNDSSAAEEGNNAAKTSAMSLPEHARNGEEGEHFEKNESATMGNASSATETSAMSDKEGEYFAKNGNAAMGNASSATETSARNGEEGEHSAKNENAAMENPSSATETSARNGKEGDHFEQKESATTENNFSTTETSAGDEAAHTTGNKTGPTADETRTATDGACPSAHEGGTAASSASTPPAPANGTTGKNGRTPRRRPWRYRAQSPFVAPNAEEVTEYALSTGHRGFDARRFVLYYQARGWVLQGGVAVADWRSLVQLWLARGENRGKHPCDTTAPQSIGAQTGNASPYGGGASQRPSTFGADTPGDASTRRAANRQTDTAVQRERTADFAMMVRDLMGETADTWLTDPVAAPHCAELPLTLATTTTPTPADTPCARSATTAEEATLLLETTSERPSDGAPAKDESRHFEPLKNELSTSLQTYNYDDESLLPQPPKNSPIAPSTADERAGAHRLVSLADGNPSSAAAAARRNRAAELRECVLALSAYDAGRVDF